VSELARFVDKMRGVEVAVIGDLIADVYLFTRPARLSREAPVLVVHYEHEEVIPGGAANTARNLSALGARAHLIAEVGADAAGGRVVEMLGAAGVVTEPILSRRDRPTVTKTRILAGDPHRTKQQLFRIDREPRRGDAPARDAETIARLEAVEKRVGGIVVSDYDLGLLSPPVCAWLRAIAARKPVIVDSRHRLKSFVGVTVVTPNEEEAEETTGLKIESGADALAVGRGLLDGLKVGAVLLTRGKHGMVLFEREREPVAYPVVGTGEVVDVSGAGDTVVAAFTAARMAGATVAESAWLSNCAASVVVMKVGAATCSRDELLAALARAPRPAPR
jgi:D-glycero-beta-D-manno-heptose-7-phosphate kinase